MMAPEGPLKKQRKKQPPGRKRMVYKLMEKVMIVRLRDALVLELTTARSNELIPRGPPTEQEVLAVLSKAKNIPMSTIDAWIRERERLFGEYLTRVAVNSKIGGSKYAVRLGKPGRHPSFPLTEKLLAKKIRATRLDQRPFPVNRVLKDYKTLAREEAIAAPPAGDESGLLWERFVAMKFGQRLQAAFLRRSDLSARKPTCIKTLPLVEVIRQARGFHKELINILVDGQRASKQLYLDPIDGRFLKALRVNDDEVGLFFGHNLHQVSETAIKACHVASPAGFGDRFATAKFSMLATQDHPKFKGLLPVQLIFFGTGKKVEKYADNEYVVVTWQKKAWIDGDGEKQWYKRVLLPYVKEMRELHGKDMEILVLKDNVKPHHDWEARRYAHDAASVLLVNTPPNTTHVIQGIDDYIGQGLRNDFLQHVNDAIYDAGADKKWTPAAKRELFVASMTKAVQLWRADPHRQGLLHGSAQRTGLAVEVGGLVDPLRTKDPFEIVPKSHNEGLIPVRFPKDYPASLMDESHASYLDFVPFTPFQPKGTVLYVPGAEAPPVAAPRPPRAAGGDTALRPPQARGDEDHAPSMSDSDSDEPDYGPSYRDEEEHDHVEEGADDPADCAIMEARNKTVRGCLPGCVCEKEGKQTRCVCHAKYGHCLLDCFCADCKMLNRGPFVPPQSDFVHVDLVGMAEGEQVLDCITGHIEDDEALYFDCVWADGTKSEEPLDNLMDRGGEWSLNHALTVYVAASSLDLAPYIKAIKDCYARKGSAGNGEGAEMEESDGDFVGD